MKIFSKLTNQNTIAKIDKIAKPFEKLPHLPKKIVSFLVFIVPWLALLGAILTILVGPIAIILSMLSLLTLNLYIIVKLGISAAFLILNGILLAKAFKPLREHKMIGWIYLFWSYVLGIISMISDLFFGELGILGFTFSTLLGAYLIFEIRKRYLEKVNSVLTAQFNKNDSQTNQLPSRS